MIWWPIEVGNNTATRDKSMEERVYHVTGTAIGFHNGDIVFDMHGHPVGQLRDTHVYSIQGQYVGELDDGMVLNKNRSLGNVGARGVAGRGGRAFASRAGRS